MNIYECDAIERDLAVMVCENEGEVTAEMMESLVKANTDTEQKRLSFCHYMRKLELDIAAHKEEEKRIADKRKVMERKLAWAKQYITPYVVDHGKQTMSTFTWSLRKSQVVDISEWYDTHNPDYNTINTTYTPDKKKLKELLKSGSEIIGASLETKQNLQFK